jgi:hypothetical protein
MAKKTSKKKSAKRQTKKPMSRAGLERRIAILELECESRGNGLAQIQKDLDQQTERNTALEFDLAAVTQLHLNLALDYVALEADRKKVGDKSCEVLRNNIELQATLGGQRVALEAHKKQWRYSVQVSEILAFIICGSKAPREFFDFFVEGANLMGYSITKDLRGAVSRALTVAQSKRLSVETQFFEEAFEGADFWNDLLERSMKVDLATDEGKAELMRYLRLAFERSKEGL